MRAAWWVRWWPAATAGLSGIVVGASTLSASTFWREFFTGPPMGGLFAVAGASLAHWRQSKEVGTMAPIRHDRRVVTPAQPQTTEHVLELTDLEDRIEAGKADPVTNSQRAAAARIRVIYNQKVGRPTEDWIKKLAQSS